MNLDSPSDNIAEITIIGTGGGYGESIVIHLGERQWMVVDSCINPFTKNSLPLEYLEGLGVDLKSEVKLVLCTHWHDDHLLGLSQLLKACSSAKFCWTEVTDKTKFLQFVSLDYQKLTRQASNSSTFEFAECLKHAKDLGNGIKLAKENTVLYGINFSSGFRSEVISLSPSDKTILNFHSEISELITEFGTSSKKIVAHSPNSKSIALYFKLGHHRAILGADLEVGEDEMEGWQNILDNNTVIDQKASLFKIPHHGSQNGYHKAVWDKLLSDRPVSGLTPWNKNNKLPNSEMLKIYKEHTDRLYMTRPTVSNKGKKRDRNIEKMIAKMNFNLVEVKYSQGIIRNRIDLTDSAAVWETELHENAIQII